MKIGRWLHAITLGLALLALGGLLAGCSSTNLAEIVKAAGTDPASVCVKLTLSTPWGTQQTQVARTNIVNGDVSCTADGLTVKSAPSSVPVGVQLVPLVRP